MSEIVFVHGVGHQFAGEDSIRSDWVPALRDGIRRAEENPPDPEQITIAFYGDLFRRKETKAVTLPPYDTSDIASDWEEDLLRLWWEEAARVEKKVHGPEDSTKARMPNWLQRALNALSRSEFFGDLALRALIGDLKQVCSYFHDDDVRERARERVEDSITNSTRVIIAHSLGTVVAYEALCRNPEWPVQGFVTLGSPLGVRNVVFDRLRPSPKNGEGKWPSGIDSWTNIADEGDLIALVKELRPRFAGPIEDQLVYNGAKAHDIRPYLTAEKTGHVIAREVAS